jgi:hypothetical protein
VPRGRRVDEDVAVLTWHSGSSPTARAGPAMAAGAKAAVTGVGRPDSSSHTAQPLLAWATPTGTNQEGGERVARTHRQRG